MQYNEIGALPEPKRWPARPLERGCNRWAVLLTAAMALLLSIWPVLNHTFISTGDYYNHLARTAVLSRYHNDPAFQAFWQLNWRFLPNLALDGLAVGLLPWFSLEATGKLIIVITLATVLAGALVLSRVAHGRWTAVSLLAGLLLINRMLLAGVVNYILGIGLVLLTLAAWMALRDRIVPRLLVLSMLATCIVTVHLIAFAVLVTAVGCVELVTAIERRSVKRLAAGFVLTVLAIVPSLLLLVLAAPHRTEPTVILFRSFMDRLAAFAVPLTYIPGIEAAGLLVLGLGLTAFQWSGQLRIDRRLAVAASVLVVMQLGMPGQIGDGTGADHRLPFPVLLLGICALDIRPRRAVPLLGFIACAGLLLVVRLMLCDRQWTRDGVLYAEAVQALMSLPPGVKVATAYSQEALVSASAPLTLPFLPAWVVVPRGGFTQTLWTKVTQHPLIMRPEFQKLSDATRPETLWTLFVSPGPTLALATLQRPALAALSNYDYVAFTDPNQFQVQPSDRLALVSKARGIQIYRVTPGAGTH